MHELVPWFWGLGAVLWMLDLGLVGARGEHSRGARSRWSSRSLSTPDHEFVPGF
jgi:hypothetical protein